MKHLNSMLMASMALISSLAMGSGQQEAKRSATEEKTQQLSIFSEDEIKKYINNPSVEQKASAANYTIPLRHLRVPIKALLKRITLGAAAIMGNEELQDDQKIAELNALHAAYMSMGLAPPSCESFTPEQRLAQLTISSQVGVIIRNQVWNQVRNQVWNQVWNQVLNQVWNQVLNQVWNQVRNQVWNQVWNQVLNQVWNQVLNQVWNQVRNQVWNQVRNQVLNQVRNQVLNQVGKQIQAILSKIDFGSAFAQGALIATLKPAIHCIFLVYQLGAFAMQHSPQMTAIRKNLASKLNKKASLESILKFRIPKSDNYLINAQLNTLSACVIHTKDQFRAFLMGTHKDVGANSSVRHFYLHTLCDKNLIGVISDFLGTNAE